MIRKRIFSDSLRVNSRFEETFEIICHDNSTIPFLFLRNNFENTFYYFHRFHISISSLEFFPLKLESKKLKIGLIANSIEDMKLGARIVRDYTLVKTLHTQVFVIPLGYDWNLTKEEATYYKDFIATNFDLLISLGGDDLHPQLYNKPNKHAKNINLDRDISEYNLVKHFKEKSKGVFLGICRGHQLSAVVDGYELIQDLSEVHHECLSKHQKYNENDPEYQFHEIQILPSLLSRLLGFKENKVQKIKVNSFHHQAVKKSEDIVDTCVAEDLDHQVIEGLISKNNKSISVQFHPELPDELNKNKEFTELGHKFIRRVICYARLISYQNKSTDNKISFGSEILPLKIKHFK